MRTATGGGATGLTESDGGASGTAAADAGGEGDCRVAATFGTRAPQVAQNVAVSPMESSQLGQYLMTVSGPGHSRKERTSQVMCDLPASHRPKRALR